MRKHGLPIVPALRLLLCFEAFKRCVRLTSLTPRFEHDGFLRRSEVARALEMLMNPPTIAPLADMATVDVLSGRQLNLAYDEELGQGHLQDARRKASGNAEMMREMESDSFTANLFDRQTGQIVSALDARWNPEYGNGGELEARIGAIISHLRKCLRFTRIFRLLMVSFALRFSETVSVF